MKVAFTGPVPDWVAACTDVQLGKRLGVSTFVRASAYARSGAVTNLTPMDNGAGLIGNVRGSGGQRYSTLVTVTADGDWAGRCSCPMQVDCKHVGAVLLTARGARPAAAQPAPSWERQLAGLVASAPVGRTLVPLGLQVDLTASRDELPRVRLRPVRPGASGRWIRTGANWRDIESSYQPVPLEPAHRQALSALWTTWRSRQPSWVSHYAEAQIYLDALGPSGWRLLREVELAGVTLLDDRGQPTVQLASAPAAVEADLRRDGPDTKVTMMLRLPTGAAGRPILVGKPATGVCLDGPAGLLLAPFDRPLDETTQALLEAPAVRVPAADLPRFFRRYYPGLARRMPVGCRDGSLELPELEPPGLALTVAFEPGHVTTLDWAFAYRFAGEVSRIPLTGASGEVDRDLPAERALLDGLTDLPDVPGVWLEVDGRRRPAPSARLVGVGTARFVNELLPVLRARENLEVEETGEPAPYQENTAPPRIAVSTSDGPAGTDWFDLGVQVTVADQDVPLGALIGALTAGEEHLVLDSGTWFSLDRPELHALRRLLDEARALQDGERRSLRVSPFHAGLWEELVSLGVIAEQSERWSRTVGGLLSLTELPQPDPPLKLQAELRPYQLQGYHWLSLLWDLGLGGILADDMGLGKTLQTLAMVARAYENGTLGGAAGPLLVVAPTSVVATWASEAARFCPDLPVVAITETERRSGLPLTERTAGAALVVTSYALLRIDEDAYLGQPWCGLVLDEAQQVKNFRSKTYSVARRIPVPFTLAITGTPLENSLMDLWSMLSLAAPGLFPDPQRFSDTYRRPIESGQGAEQLTSLRRRIRPLMLRRTKEQVAADLPPKVEQVLEVALTPTHRRIYDKHLQRERQRVLGLLDDLQRNRFEILRSLTLLRQLSLDPALVEDRHVSVGSAKIDALAEALREVADEGHRALVFSSFTGFLRRVRDRLDADGIGYCYLDGRTRDRPRRIEQFRTGTDPAFLISLKAGGTGLTLTEADYVFVLDPWWNPATEAQAVDRAHRIGQRRTVMVYRLVATDTIEEKVVALQQRKRDLFAQVVDGDGSASGALSAEDIRALLG